MPEKKLCFRSQYVVEAQHLQFAMDLNELIQCPHHTGGWQTGVDLDAQCFTVEVIQHVEGAEPSLLPQRIGYEVDRPDFVGMNGHRERCLHACWQASLALALQVQPQRFLRAKQAAFAKALAPNRRVQLVEAVGRVHRDVTLDGHDHGPVLAWSGGHVAPLSQQVHHRITLKFQQRARRSLSTRPPDSVVAQQVMVGHL